ncbi:putative ATP-grasp-modified RiPP [Streptomyces sp. ST2-7A]|uniref:putative ATP-grasp-modified RiPP n=1 Tax=Streptomyces sp. ST2-7A TaxID=2907214 RepID=UPI001F3D7C65|nr:putative ATP-grasp-modified RiPP [Streptomyces sp. ST2-7A]
MESYPAVIRVTGRAVMLDPESQTTVYHDATGKIIDMGTHGTGTGQETKTRTSGDGQGPNNLDQGSDQENDQDQP